jgi:NAD(P)-dependent dehydrogenase (short-subunit alcohol dehydrogenase family)
VASEAEVDALVERSLDHFGAIDMLVNNAGVTEATPAEDEPLEVWNRVLGVNLTGTFLAAQRFSRVMLQAG